MVGGSTIQCDFIFSISQNSSPKQPPNKNLHIKNQKNILTQDPGTTQPEGNSTHLDNINHT